MGAMRRAFTLIELVVAMGILAIILSFAGVIFRVSTESQRMAMANAEIMQKLRVITGQLDADFKGLIGQYSGYSIASALAQTAPNGATYTTNLDGMAFLANGDFRTTRPYGGQTIVGNVASLYYGPPDPNSYLDASLPLPEPRDRILLRRQTILAPEAPPANSDPHGEYYRASLEQWRTLWSQKLDEWYRRPVVDPNNLESQLPMYLAKGVSDFTIHYLDRAAGQGTGVIAWQRPVPVPDGSAESVPISPRAFKVTFTLYDSRGVIKDGRTFTHIVLVGG